MALDKKKHGNQPVFIPFKQHLAKRLEQAGRLAAAGHVDEACAVLQQLLDQGAHRQDQVPLGLAELLWRAATRARNKHPAAAMVLLQRAVAVDAAYMPAWSLLASVLDKLGDLPGAKAACLSVVKAAHSDPEQVLSAANLLVRHNESRLAIEAASKAFESLGRPLQWASSLLYIALRVADWPLVDQLTAQLLGSYKVDGATNAAASTSANESPRTHLLWCGDETINLRVLKAWSEQAISIPAKISLPVPVPAEGRRLKVGYLSSDFREHPTSRLVNGLFRHHNREKFELVMYCSGWDDESAMRREVESHFDHIHSVTKLSDDDAAQLMRGHGLDVLVELNGPTRANRMGILAHRPAPVQIDYLGWPGSVGGRVVDYVVGDTSTVPGDAHLVYPERVIRLEGTYQVNDYAAQPPLQPAERKALGLPEDALVLGMFNAINKVREEVWAAWMEIMRAHPKCVLWILNPGVVACENIAKACKRHGVRANRVIVAPSLPQAQHLRRLQACDLMLDPWPYGGHTSTSDALFAGVPVLVLEGQNFAGRVSAGLLRSAGLRVLVQPDVGAYIRTGINLLQKPAEIEKLKRFLKAKVMSTDVFNAKGRAAQLEAAYAQAFQWVQQGKKDQHMVIRKPPLPQSSHQPQKALRRDVDMPKTRNRERVGQTTKGNDRMPLILVCGPWSSGTSAMAGFLAKAGLPAPGPYFATNDPRTSETFEMKAFRDVLNGLVSEVTLKPKESRTKAVEVLRAFASGTLRQARESASVPPDRPVLLKHALPALLLPELAEVFDLKVVGVLRPLADIEATRQRRRWGASFGRAGAAVLYRRMFHELVESSVPFRLVRYVDLLKTPELVMEDLAQFCGFQTTQAAKQAALSYLRR